MILLIFVFKIKILLKGYLTQFLVLYNELVANKHEYDFILF
jgi:hypothetical protein